MQYMNDGRTIVSGGGDNFLRTWTSFGNNSLDTYEQ
jgi:hypothetical protein